MKKLTLLIALCLISFQYLMAQEDSLVFKNKNIIVGEIKSMDKGILKIETDYSDSDFTIEWEEIIEVYSKQNYLISLQSGKRLNGKINSSSPGKVLINSVEQGDLEVNVDEIVFFTTYEDDFWSRLSASVDINYSFTKANNLKQSGITSTLGYVASKWSANAGYNLIRSSQDDVEPTRREDGNFSFKKFLPKDFYIPVNYSFLSNTEQLLDIRSNFTGGIGKYILHTNNAYFGLEGGASYVKERYSSDAPTQNSWEAYLGSELNLYDIGDLNLYSRVVIYPGITEKGRFRSDFNFNAKYDLPLDFYIKAGFTLNFDNQAVEGASSTDYVLQTGFGWEL
ncbi:DUF481 domain-containing protein [Echinicola sp. 20G]|uniref:DUF481 domain-containing protein n=1 Tax=Echinicola sp. 20G TaxID=2781961 RepID=UPI0019103B77|nr:DUF481 domain-containing protein [Echinicola sp. 20G]